MGNEEEVQEKRQNLRQTDNIFVIDGGALLHRVILKKKGSYAEILKQYQSYLESKYGKCVIVFDGYLSGPSTKDHEHQRRKKGNKGCASITIDVNLQVQGNQDNFLCQMITTKQVLLIFLAKIW